MQRIGSSTFEARHQSGFTLIGLLVVIVIIADSATRASGLGI